MNICFLMYPWERIDPETDTTLRLIHECVRRGHRVAVTNPGSLTMRETLVFGFCNLIQLKKKLPDNAQHFYRHVEFKRAKLPMAGFDCIFMRANPPLDVLALNFLDSVREQVFIMNDVDGMRVANNKLYTAALADPAGQYIPKTHVSKNKEYLQSVLAESATDTMILKPLTGYGGHGVILIEKRAHQNFRSLLDFYIGEGEGSHYVILQEYVEGAEKGDVRILMLNGEPIGAMRRVPSPGDIRSNIHAGGHVEKHQLTASQKQLCRAIGPKLVRDGLYFVGIDVIGDKLIEVNVLSPGGITRINKLNRARLQSNVIDFIEQVVNAREILVERKQSFRQVLADVDPK